MNDSERRHDFESALAEYQGLCYGGNDGETGGVETKPEHLSQAAKLSHQAGPPLFAVDAVGQR